MYVKDFGITMAERMADVPSGPWDTLTENASLEYEANVEAPVYLRLLYTVIHDVLEWQCRRISFGRTALDAKARLGAQPAPLFTWLRHRNPVANVAVGALACLVPHETAPKRHPMKQNEIA